MDYSKAKIYKILNTINESCYIGSTCQPLSKRMAKHRSVMNSCGKKDRLLYTSMRELGVNNFYIELIIELNDIQNIEQLRKVEGEYIRQLGTLNMTVAGRSKTQWEEEHKEHLKELAKQRYIENIEDIKAKKKKYDEEHREQKMERNRLYYLNNLDKRKDYNTKNKEIQKIKSKEYYDRKKDEVIDCEVCGCQYHRIRQYKHIKTKKHQQALNNITNNEDNISDNI